MVEPKPDMDPAFHTYDLTLTDREVSPWPRLHPLLLRLMPAVVAPVDVQGCLARLAICGN